MTTVIKACLTMMSLGHALTYQFDENGEPSTSYNAPYRGLSQPQEYNAPYRGLSQPQEYNAPYRGLSQPQGYNAPYRGLSQPQGYRGMAKCGEVGESCQGDQDCCSSLCVLGKDKDENDGECVERYASRRRSSPTWSATTTTTPTWSDTTTTTPTWRAFRGLSVNNSPRPVAPEPVEANPVQQLHRTANPIPNQINQIPGLHRTANPMPTEITPGLIKTANPMPIKTIPRVHRTANPMPTETIPGLHRTANPLPGLTCEPYNAVCKSDHDCCSRNCESFIDDCKMKGTAGQPLPSNCGLTHITHLCQPRLKPEEEIQTQPELPLEQSGTGKYRTAQAEAGPLLTAENEQLNKLFEAMMRRLTNGKSIKLKVNVKNPEAFLDDKSDQPCCGP